VLIYLTGLGGFRQSNLFQVENLVSQGYIVVGLDQPYNAIAVKLPGGNVVYQMPESEILPSVYQSLGPSQDAPILNGQPQPEGIIPYLSHDATFALDQLTALNATSTNGILPGHLDLNHTGIFGVSLGAMTTAEVCHQDPRFSACLMMDAAMPADVAQPGLRQPSMWITRPAADMRLENSKAGGWPEKDVQQTLSTMQAAYAKSKPEHGYYVSIAGMFHHNYFDIPYWTPIMALAGQIGPINPQRGFDIINAYTLNFFDQKLKGQNSPLLNGPSHEYPEATFQKK